MSTTSEALRALIDKLLQGAQQYVVVKPAGSPEVDVHAPKLILSGSFNPLHHGHVRLLEAARNKHPTFETGFELSIVNADKPPLQVNEVLRRAAQFTGRYALILSTKPTFVQKAALFPGSTFVIGYDTAMRLLEPRFYTPATVAGMEAALDAIRAAGCSFLVAGRLVDGRFNEAAGFEAPPLYTTLFTPLPFRDDVSSTQVRLQIKKEHHAAKL